MFTLIFNKRLRENYSKILTFQNAEEIENFLSALNEKERDEIFAYVDGHVIRERHRAGIPVTEYFLLHYDEFMPEETKKAFIMAEKHLNIIFLVASIIILTVMLF